MPRAEVEADMTLTYADVSRILTIIDSVRDEDLDLSLGGLQVAVTSWRQEPETTGSSVTPAQAKPQPADKSEPLLQTLYEIRASQLGYFVAAPGLKVGRQVRKGEPVATIAGPGDITEEVEAPMDGRIVDLCLDDGDFVEYAQTLAMLDTTDEAGSESRI